MTSHESTHLTDEQLLLYADGELVGGATEAARAHLEACWSCRARLDDLHATIHAVVRFRNEALLPSVAPPPAPWPGLRPRLEAVRVRRRSFVERVREVLASWAASREIVPHRRWGVVTAVALAMLAVILWPRPSVLSAREILHQAEQRPVVSAHRRVFLEERHVARGTIVAQREIDIWHNTATGVRARRVYDERDRLLAGEWTRRDGSRTVYRPGAAPQLVAPGTPYTLDVSDLWRLELSPGEYAALVPLSDSARVTDRPSDYVIAWEETPDRPAGALVGASLTLAKGSLHPTAQTLRVRRGGELREFRFTETAFTPVAPEAIPMAMLLPGPALLEPIASPPVVRAPLKPPAPRRLTAAELVELEVDALARLDGLGALLGEQVTVERDQQRGQIRVQALVDSDGRKQELLSGLGPLARSPDIVLDITTIAEALARQPESDSDPTTVTSVEIPRKPAPVHEDLRRHFVDQLRREGGGSQRDPGEDAVNREIQRFTSTLINRSLQARLHARALTQAVERFSLGELRALSPSARKRLRGVIEPHAVAFEQETETLRRDLESIFASTDSTDGTGADVSIASDADLVRATARLFELGSFHDATIARTFSLSADEPKPDAPAWQPFYRSLRTAERLAAEIKQWVTRP